MSHSEQIGELAAALAKAQGCMSAAEKDKQNPFFKSSYADLHSVWEACRKPLSDNGLAIVQTLDNGSDKIYLHTVLVHVSGQWIKSSIPLFLLKQDSQSLGSAVTYAKRIALSAMVGVSVTEKDDDAEEAMARPSQQKKPKYSQDTFGLEDYLRDQGMPLESLSEFIEGLSSKTAVSYDKIVNNATMNEQMMTRFRDSYKRWLDAK